jgi:hypothetical protein
MILLLIIAIRATIPHAIDHPAFRTPLTILFVMFWGFQVPVIPGTSGKDYVNVEKACVPIFF